MVRDSQANIYSTYYDNIDQILKDLENECQFKQLLYIVFISF